MQKSGPIKVAIVVREKPLAIVMTAKDLAANIPKAPISEFDPDLKELEGYYVALLQLPAWQVKNTSPFKNLAMSFKGLRRLQERTGE